MNKEECLRDDRITTLLHNILRQILINRPRSTSGHISAPAILNQERTTRSYYLQQVFIAATDPLLTKRTPVFQQAGTSLDASARSRGSSQTVTKGSSSKLTKLQGDGESSHGSSTAASPCGVSSTSSVDKAFSFQSRSSGKLFLKRHFSCARVLRRTGLH